MNPADAMIILAAVLAGLIAGLCIGLYVSFNEKRPVEMIIVVAPSIAEGRRIAQEVLVSRN